MYLNSIITFILMFLLMCNVFIKKFNCVSFCLFLSVNDNVQQILPWAVSAVAVSYVIYVTFCCSKKKGRVNSNIQKDCDKVVHSLDIEDIGKKAVFCRCWKSSKVS